MRIAVHAGDGAGAALRLRWPAEALAAQGFDVNIGTPIQCAFRNTSERTASLAGHPMPWVEIQDCSIDADVLVIQRPLEQSWLTVIPMLQAQGVRVVVDLDDLLTKPHKENAGWFPCEPHWLHNTELKEWQDHYGPQRVTKRNGDWSYCPDIESVSSKNHLLATVALADHVACATPFLADHFGKIAKSVSVVRNCIPERYLRFGRTHLDDAILKVGWTGRIESHPRDLQQMGRGLANVRMPMRFIIIGPQDGIEKAAGRKVNKATGFVSLAQYPQAYSLLDIAIAPLHPSDFNTAKSWLKPLEAASLGLPVVMSPSDEYRELHSRGVGLVASTPEEWTDRLEMLLGSSMQRDNLRRKGLEVAETLTIEGHAHDWLTAWSGGQTEKARRPVIIEPVEEPRRIRTGSKRDITVAIPTITPRADLLAAAVKSVHAQTQPVDAIAIALDSNHDGAWTTRNRAASMVRTTWTAFLDDDDELRPHHVEHLLDCAEDQGADLVWGWFDVVAPHGISGGHGRDPFPHNRGKQYDPARPHCVPITYVVRTELLHDAMTKMGGFLPDTTGDWDNQDQPLFDTIIELGAKTFASERKCWIWTHHRHGGVGNTSGLPSRW